MKEELKRQTNFISAHQLVARIKLCNTLDEIKSAIKWYWDLPENKLARSSKDDKEFREYQAEFFCSFDWNLDQASEMAEASPYIYDALKNRLLEILKDNSVITDTQKKTIIMILSSSRPKNKRSALSSSWHKTIQLAVCAWIVMQNKPDNIKISLTSPDKANLNSIYTLVADATGKSPDAVRDALKQHPEFSINAAAKNRGK